MATRSIMANEEQELVPTRGLTRRANSCSKCGPIPSTLRCGGVPTDLLTQSASWTYGQAAPSVLTCAPNSNVYPMTGVFQEIVPPERLVFTSAALGGNGSPMFELLNTVTFAEQGDKTKQILRVRVIKKTAQAEPYLAWMEVGWTQSLERLASYMAIHSKEQAS